MPRRLRPAYRGAWRLPTLQRLGIVPSRRFGRLDRDLNPLRTRTVSTLHSRAINRCYGTVDCSSRSGALETVIATILLFVVLHWYTYPERALLLETIAVGRQQPSSSRA